jgi:hypothetical protein
VSPVGSRNALRLITTLSAIGVFLDCQQHRVATDCHYATLVPTARPDLRQTVGVDLTELRDSHMEPSQRRHQVVVELKSFAERVEELNVKWRRQTTRHQFDIGQTPAAATADVACRQQYCADVGR